MPIYEYHCNSCDSEIELLVRSDKEIKCSNCGSEDLKKKLSLFGFSTGSSQPECASGCGGGFDKGSCGSGMCGA